MKRELILCTCILCIIFTLSACSSEARGVPDSVICRDANYDTNDAAKYTVIHNVDTAAHIDDAQLKLYYKGTYGTKTIIAPYSYQYNKASDTWTLLEEGNSTSEQELNEDAYIKASPWTGEAEGFHDFSYSITFHKIDMKKMNATISYEIDFKDDGIPDLSDYTTVDLIEVGGSFNLHFLIDYSYPGIASTNEETLWFWLGVDYGLKPF